MRFFPNKTNNPPGGWRFTVEETGATLRGTSLGEVMVAVKKHWEVNGIEPIEDLEREIERRICEEVPEYCGAKGMEIKPVPKNRGRTIHEVITGTKTIGMWLAKRAMGGGNVSVEVAERRASVCVGCVENTEPTGCSSCNKAASSQVLDKLVPFRTSKDAALKSCRVCGCWLSAKIACQLDIIRNNMPDYVKKELPDHCWVKTEQVSDE